MLILGTVMYVVEGPQHGFTSIPMAMYWATVTMTAVGYGDLTPQTGLGKLIAAFMTLLGWGVLAVPTGIVTSEMPSQRMSRREPNRTCPECLSEGHEHGARFCKDCGAGLPAAPVSPWKSLPARTYRGLWRARLTNIKQIKVHVT